VFTCDGVRDVYLHRGVKRARDAFDVMLAICQARDLDV
jgi:hypothetical protein